MDLTLVRGVITPRTSGFARRTRLIARCILAASLGTWALSSPPARAQTSSPRVRIHVTEAGGIRRSSFPVSARIPFPRGVLVSSANTRLVQNDTEVPAQMTTTAQWQDGSVQWLEVDFNASPGPGETLEYAIEHGPGVQAAPIARGLAVTDEETAIQVGNMRFNKKGSPLIASVKYREDAIGTGRNGLVVTDAAGGSHDLSNADALGVQLLKRGPLYVKLRYTGLLPLDGDARAPITVDIEMPSSKSWVKVSATVTDPRQRVRSLALVTPLALGPLPWVWDFGTTRWTYGSLRAPADAVAIEQVLGTSPAWTVTTTVGGRSQPYETSRPDNATFAGWGHVQGGREVMAFAIEKPATTRGTYRVSMTGTGETAFGFTPATPQPAHTLTVYQHYVSTPVQIGAATSPAAILSPLRAVSDREQYIKSGVQPPAAAR